jgi:hypothetical protein
LIKSSGSQPFSALGTQNARKHLAAHIYQDIFRKIALFQKLQPKSPHFPQKNHKSKNQKCLEEAFQGTPVAKHCSRVNFTNVLNTHFFVRKPIAQLFSITTVWLCDFLVKGYQR